MRPQIRLLTTSLLCAVSLFASGCATIIRGTTDKVVFTSNPEGATVTLSSGETGTTPVTWVLPRIQSLKVDFSKEGYEPVNMTLHSVPCGSGRTAIAGNAILGGAIGATIDANNGAAMTLLPNPMAAKLRKLEPRNTPLDWSKLKTGMDRIDLRDLLGDPANIAGGGRDQTWVYPDGGRITLKNYEVSAFTPGEIKAVADAPAGAATESPSQAIPTAPASSSQ